MKEILDGGNFGQDFGLKRATTGRKYWIKTMRNIRLVRMCPSEALCEPWFRTWHFFWRGYAKLVY
jgi:hypothetical protein